MAGIIELVLERDGHDQPWGFRLQGGADLNMPLSVQRVLVGTPSEGLLRKGDIIIKISHTETKNISHQQAADLFNSAGNQITVQLKRAGVQSSPSATTSASVPLVNGSPVPAPVPVPVPVAGGVPLPGIANTLLRSENPAVKALPKTQFSLKTHFARQQKPPPANLDTLSIQTQPYRTLPLLQPSAKPRTDLGVSSINSHLKTQEDYFNMPKESLYVPNPHTVIAKAKQDDLLMKQKITGTLQHIQHAQHGTATLNTELPSGIVNKQYNSPLPLYSQENVQEAIKMQASQGTNAGHPINKPQKHVFYPGMPLTYDPERSATWQIIHEQENCQLVTEHGPTKSKVYSI